MSSNGVSKNCKKCKSCGQNKPFNQFGKGRGKNDLTSFIIEKGMPGFSLGQKIIDKCGMRASNTAELVFDNVEVPVENVVGEVGGATMCMHRNLEIERLVLAAMSLGIARRSIEVMTNYAQERKAFGNSIGSFGQIQKAICHMEWIPQKPRSTRKRREKRKRQKLRLAVAVL